MLSSLFVIASSLAAAPLDSSVGESKSAHKPVIVASPLYAWQIGFGGGAPQLGGVMLRHWWNDRSGVAIRGFANASRELRPNSTYEYSSDTGYVATGEFAFDIQYLRQIFRLEARNRLAAFANPTWLRGLAYAGVGGYAYYEDREIHRNVGGYSKYDPNTGMYGVWEPIYNDEVVHEETRRWNAVGGAGIEFGLGRISANLLLGYGLMLDSDLKQYEFAPAGDFGVAFGF